MEKSPHDVLHRQVEGQRPVAGKQQTDGSAKEAERRALDQQLAHNPPAGGSHGGADGDLPGAAEGAAQHHVRHVGAGDQQHEPHGAQHEEKDQPDLSAVLILLERHDDDTDVLV
jgi:hypothetical protein